jgi:hypothetical protein
MPTRVRLFVSAGPDLEMAREMLGQALAELPINIGWMIKRTPDIDAVAETHLFMLILGKDILAPVGLELWWARRTEKPILAYRSEGPYTPACQVFMQDNADLRWSTFGQLAQLRRLALRDLARFLASHAERYGLTVQEGEVLSVYLKQLEQVETVRLPKEPAGAGGGGVILAPGKDEPPGARLVEGGN